MKKPPESDRGAETTFSEDFYENIHTFCLLWVILNDFFFVRRSLLIYYFILISSAFQLEGNT